MWSKLKLDVPVRNWEKERRETGITTWMEVVVCGDLLHSFVHPRRTHSADVKSGGLGLLLVAAGQDHPGSSLRQTQSRGLTDAGVASCAGQKYPHVLNSTEALQGADNFISPANYWV